MGASVGACAQAIHDDFGIVARCHTIGERVREQVEWMRDRVLPRVAGFRLSPE